MIAGAEVPRICQQLCESRPWFHQLSFLTATFAGPWIYG
jgi:hypothetical protein